MSRFRAFQKGFWIMVAVLNVASCILCLWLVLRGGAGHTNVFHRRGSEVPVVVDYKDFVSILLTSLGLMIGLGSALIAGIAVFGYAEGRRLIEGWVRQAVADQLEPTVARYLSSGGYVPG